MTAVTITAEWLSNPDADGYRLYHNGVLVHDGPEVGWSWDADIPDGAHNFSLEAYNQHGQEPRQTISREFQAAPKAPDPTEGFDVRIVQKIVVGPPPTGGIIPEARRTTWNPGLNAVGGIPNRTTIYTTLSPLGGGLDDTPQIQAAINACPDGQVVQLTEGWFDIQGILTLGRSNITLRGAGSADNDGVRLAFGSASSGQTVLAKPYYTQQPCVQFGHQGDFGAAINLTTDAVKGTYSVTLASTAGLSPGDFVWLDEAFDVNEDPPRTVYNSGDPRDNYGATRFERPISEVKEIDSINGLTVTFVTPFHITFRTSKAAQLVTFTQPFVEWSGIEDLKIMNGENHGNLNVRQTAYCWAKNLESENGHEGGFRLQKNYRFELRDSYCHDARSNGGPSGDEFTGLGSGGSGYGIHVDYGTADSLIENCIVVAQNKVTVSRQGGGGNVFGYNYVDDGMLEWNVTWIETGLNAAHNCTPFQVLMEGNLSWTLDGENFWGNTLSVTWLRNHGTGNRGNVCGYGLTNKSMYLVAVPGFNDDWNFVGNVLGLPGMETTGIAGGPAVYEYAMPSGGYIPGYPVYAYGYNNNAPSIPLDHGVIDTVLREGNHDYLFDQTLWDTAPQTISNSLYLTSKPSFFGANDWPWIDPLGATDADKIKTLPAKARFDAMTRYLPNQTLSGSGPTTRQYNRW